MSFYTGADKGAGELYSDNCELSEGVTVDPGDTVTAPPPWAVPGVREEIRIKDIIFGDLGSVSRSISFLVH